MVGTSHASSPRPGRTTIAALLTCSVTGTVHGLVSLYWATGGGLLTSTISGQLAAIDDARWLLFPVAAIKTGFALLPLVLLTRRCCRLRRTVRVLCWFGTAVLLLWGGTTTIIGNLVLAGFVHPASGYDRAAMIGHAWLWDPLFLLWGAALLIGLVSGRGGTTMACMPST